VWNLSENFQKDNGTFPEKFRENFPAIRDIKMSRNRQEMSTISRNKLRKIKEQLNNRKSHYGQWT